VNEAVKDARIVFGAGCSEMLMAKAVDELVPRTSGKKAHAIEGFARALRRLPAIIAENGGYDGADLATQLRAEHHKGNSTAGLDMVNGTIGDAKKLGVVEALKLKESVLLNATEAAEMILRVDEIIRAPPRKREQDDMHH
jgi:T-complex protein 1 subunit beta